MSIDPQNYVSSPAAELTTQAGIIDVCLSWDFLPGQPVIDLDVSAVCFSSTGNLVDAAYYNQLSACNESLKHSGDSLKGENNDVDERISLDLDKVTGIAAIVFVLSAFSSGDLKYCESALLEIKQSGHSILSVSVGGPEIGSKSGLLLAMIFKDRDTLVWHFRKLMMPCAARHFMGCLLPMRKFVSEVLDPGLVGECTLSMDKTFKMEKGDNFKLPLGTRNIAIGLGWTTKNSDLDLDASCTVLQDVDLDGDLDPVGIIYFGNKVMAGIKSLGDNRSGAGDGDDETILVDFDDIPSNITNLAFIVTIYTLHRTFSEVTSSYVRLYDRGNGHEFARFTLSGDLKKNGVIFCMLVRGADMKSWSVLVIGEQCEGRTAREVRTPLWDSGGGASLSPTVATVTPQANSSSSQAQGDGGCCCVIS